MKNILLIIILTLALISSVIGQDLSSYYSYLINKFNVNPALIGNTQNYQGVLDSRSEMTGVDGAPKNLMFALHGPIYENQGLGVKVISDSRGVFNTSRFDATYSHRFFLQRAFYLRFGLSAGILKNRIESSSIQSKSRDFNFSDPTINSETLNDEQFLAGFGVVSEYKDWQFGFSSPHIVKNESPIDHSLVGLLSYNYKVNEK